MKSLVFLLEEPSAQDLIEGLLPRLVPDAIGELAALGDEFGKPALASVSLRQKLRDPGQRSGAVTEIRSLGRERGQA